MCGDRRSSQEDAVARVAIQMPKFGHDLSEGTVAGWLKTVGDRIARGDTIAEIAPEQATGERVSPVAGTLVEIVAPAGTQLPVGTVIAYVETEDSV
jgi:pyruvate dehydrogenase E2 component (dihydrolipoamide acetyltransferase)